MLGQSPMQHVKEKLLRAVQQGTALATAALVAGCAGGETSGGNGPGPGALEPYPLEQIRCEGPTLDGGYFGQCCFRAHCYTPEAGGACVPATSDELYTLLPAYPPGSGTCGCMTEEFPTTGPFAARDGATPASAGTCCYVLGAIGCEGRPLLDAGAPVLAPVFRRGDWGGIGGVA